MWRRGPVLAVASAVGLAVVGAHDPLAAAPVTPLPRVSDTEVADASFGVTLFVLDHLDDVGPIADPCPLLTPEQLGFFMGQQGFAPSSTGYEVSLFREAEVTTGSPGLQCGVDVASVAASPDPATPHAVVLDAFVPVEGVTVEDLATYYETTPLGPGADDLGGRFAGVCGSISGQPVCLLSWVRGELVVQIALAGPGVTLDATIALMNAMLPSIIQSLIDYGGVSTAPTTVAPPTVPIATAAVPTTAVAPPVSTVAPATTTVPATAVPSTVVPVTVAPSTVAPPPTVASPTAPATSAVTPTVAATAAPPTAAPATTVVAVPVPPTTGPTGSTVPSTGSTTVPTTASAGGLDVAAAKATLASFIAGNPVGTDVAAGTTTASGCPALGPTPVATAMEQLGLQPNRSEFVVSVYERTDWTPGIAYVACGANTGGAAAGIPPGVAPHFASVEFYDITGRFTWPQVLATLSDATPTAVPGLGGEIAGGCSAFPSTTFCAVLWHLDGFIIRLSLVGPPATIDETTARSLLVSLIPQAVSDLATNVFWP